MTDRGSVLDRVRKLLALAESPNVFEAAAAAARAQALIATHRLEGLLAQEAAEPILDARDSPLESGKRLRKWKIALAATLAEANGCVAYTLEGPREDAIVLVGRETDREAVRALYGWLVKAIGWLSATEGAGRSRDWHEAFRIGAVDAIAERLREVPAAPAEGAALVRAEAALAERRAALDAYVAAHLRLGPGRGLRVRADAYEAGRRKGRELPLVR